MMQFWFALRAQKMIEFLLSSSEQELASSNQEQGKLI